MTATNTQPTETPLPWPIPEVDWSTAFDGEPEPSESPPAAVERLQVPDAVADWWPLGDPSDRRWVRRIWAPCSGMTALTEVAQQTAVPRFLARRCDHDGTQWTEVTLIGDVDGHQVEVTATTAAQLQMAELEELDRGTTTLAEVQRIAQQEVGLPDLTRPLTMELLLASPPPPPPEPDEADDDDV